MTKDQDLRAAEAQTLPDEGEPVAIFQTLPEIDFGTDELADMKRSVHELIHARAVEAAIEEGHVEGHEDSTQPATGRSAAVRAWARRIPHRLRHATSSAGLRVAAALAAVALATSLLVPSFAPRPLRVAQAPLAASTPASAELAAALAEIESLPLVENLGSDTDLIQIEDDEMSLVVAAIQ